jgi:hypothetical protein
VRAAAVGFGSEDRVFGRRRQDAKEFLREMIGNLLREKETLASSLGPVGLSTSERPRKRERTKARERVQFLLPGEGVNCLPVHAGFRVFPFLAFAITQQ